MTPIKAIQLRTSSRTFNGLHLDKQILTTISDYCQTVSTTPQPGEPAPLFENITRPTIFLIADCHAEGNLGTYGVIKGACSYLVMACGESREEQMLGGYLFEKVILFCTQLGVDTCWLGGTLTKNGFQVAYEQAHPTGKQRVMIASPAGHRTPTKRFAERLFRSAISSNKRKPFDTLFSGVTPATDAMFNTLLQGTALNNITNSERLALALECVRLAPSSRNSQPWRANVRMNSNSSAFSVEFLCTTSSAFSAIDMGIAFAHFTEATELMNIHGSWIHHLNDDKTIIFSSLK